MITVIAQMKIRRDTAANWTSVDPTPAEGEWCLETDTGFVKMGDGVTAWTSLPYFAGSGSGISELTGDVTAGPGSGSQAATIAADAVTNPKLANMAQSRLKGRAAAAGTGDPTDLTPDQASTILDGATDPFVRTSAAGSGDVVGPASSVDERIVLFDGVTGKLIQDAGIDLSEVVETDGNPAGVSPIGSGAGVWPIQLRRFVDGTGTTVQANTGSVQFNINLTVQVTGITLVAGSWSLVSGLYEYDLANANIASTSIVEVIPDNADIAVVQAAEVLPRTDSGAGTVKLYATNAPSGDIGVTINIYPTT